MNDAVNEEEDSLQERYKEKKADGELFFPDSIAKDAIVSLVIFVLLILLAVFVGRAERAAGEPGRHLLYPAA